MNANPLVTLPSGDTVPALGQGTWTMGDSARHRKEEIAALRLGLDLGMSLIDTAEMYGNEAEVGEAIAGSGLDRGEVFVTSKLSNDAHEPDEARQAFEETLKALGTDYVDLFLIHWPLPTLYGGDFVSTWKTLEEFKADGRARSIGVSNFQVAHLERLAAETDTVPAVNQIEAHPYFQNNDVRIYGEERGIATEAWSPIARGTRRPQAPVSGDSHSGAVSRPSLSARTT